MDLGFRVGTFFRPASSVAKTSPGCEVTGAEVSLKLVGPEIHTLWGFPKIRGTLLWGPFFNKEPTIWGTILGFPIFGNPPHFRGSSPELSDPTKPLLSRCRDKAESADSPEIQTTYMAS